MFVKVRDGADISDGKVSEFESFCLNTRHKHINHSKPLVFSAHKNNSSSSSRFSNAWSPWSPGNTAGIGFHTWASACGEFHLVFHGELLQKSKTRSDF